MTIETMQWHEAVTLRYGEDDYRRASLVELARPLARGKAVLDMRCLTGAIAVPLAAAGHEVVALDGYAPAAEMTNARARKLGVSRDIAQVWDLTGLTTRVGRDRFDTVFCLDVLNHVPDDVATVREIAEVLKPGGRLVLAAPAFPSLLGQRDRSLGHLRRYSREQLRGLLAEHGLLVQLVRYWNFAAFPLYAAVETIARRRIADPLRYARGKRTGAVPNTLLRSWFIAVENRIRPPFGLTHFIVAQRA